jgi:predicted nucleic acid-binding protein
VILLDTNILLRYVSRTDPSHRLVRSIVRGLLSSGDILCVVPQNIYEFWAVATRPLSVNGLGLSVAETDTEFADIVATFRFLPDLPGLFAEGTCWCLRTAVSVRLPTTPAWLRRCGRTV